jgi:hypothetical protein
MVEEQEADGENGLKHVAVELTDEQQAASCKAAGTFQQFLSVAQVAEGGAGPTAGTLPTGGAAVSTAAAADTASASANVAVARELRSRTKTTTTAASSSSSSTLPRATSSVPNTRRRGALPPTSKPVAGTGE